MYALYENRSVISIYRKTTPLKELQRSHLADLLTQPRQFNMMTWLTSWFCLKLAFWFLVFGAANLLLGGGVSDTCKTWLSMLKTIGNGNSIRWLGLGCITRVIIQYSWMVAINLWASFLSNVECKRLGSFIIERSNPIHLSLRYRPPYVDLASTWHHSLSRPSPFLNGIVLVHIVQWSYVIKLHTWEVPVATQARTKDLDPLSTKLNLAKILYWNAFSE